jgi:hypothetical protein
VCERDALRLVNALNGGTLSLMEVALSASFV